MKTRGIKIVTLFLIIALAMIVFVPNFLIKQNNSINKEEHNNGVYAFNEETISQVDYQGYDEFEVSSVEGYLSFVKSTWANSTIGATATKTSSAGYDYNGKVIKQTKDLDLSHVDNIVIDVFAGTYDGQGFTLKLGENKSLAHRQEKEGVYPMNSSAGDEYYKGGFCNVLEGTLQNSVFFVKGTKLENIYAKGDTVYLGSVIGKNQGVIESLAVASLSYTAILDSQTFVRIGVIAGDNYSGTVKYCIVTGGNSISLKIRGGMQSYYELGVFVGSGEALYCLSEITSSRVIYDMTTGEDQTSDNPEFIKLAVGSNNANSYKEIYKFPKHAASQEGGADESSGWYLYPAGYYYQNSPKFPSRLRKSMKWAEIQIEIEPSGAASEKNASGKNLCYVTPKQKIYVPEAHLEASKNVVSRDGLTLNYFGQSRNAVADSSSMYEFDVWATDELEDNNVIKAVYRLKKFTVTFVDAYHCSESSALGHAIGYEYVVEATTKISVTMSPYTKEGYRSMAFSFAGETVTYTISNNSHYIVNSNIGNSEHIVNDNITISISTALKEYSVNVS